MRAGLGPPPEQTRLPLISAAESRTRAYARADKARFQVDPCHILKCSRRVLQKQPVVWRWSERGAEATRPIRAASPSAPGRWAEALRDADDEGVAQLRTATHVGRPLGDEALLDRLERELARPVRARPVGRPRFDKGQEQ